MLQSRKYSHCLCKNYALKTLKPREHNGAYKLPLVWDKGRSQKNNLGRAKNL